MWRWFPMLIVVGCSGSPDLPTPPPEYASGSVEILPLETPIRVAGAHVFMAPEGPPVDHVTHLAWDPDDRWRDDFSGGFAALDCDLDGDIDLLFTSGLGEHSLQLNRGDGTFDRADDAGVAFPGDATASASTADFDNDGDPDVLLLVQFGPNRLLVNDGHCRFEDRAPEYGLDDEHRSLHATWVDFDSDGQLDLYLTNWAGARGDDEPGTPAEPHPDRFWLRDDDGGFVEITDQLPEDTAVAYGMLTGFLDLDGDGDYELIQTNDRGGQFVSNRIFDNLGQDADGRWQFEDVTVELGFFSQLDGMGLAFADVDNDGDPDIFNSGSFETLFLNEGDGSFIDSGLALGLDSPDPTTLSWGGSLFDPDADGDLDLLFVRSFFWDSGPDSPSQYMDVARFFRNSTGPTFAPQNLEGTPFGGEANWRAAVTIDLDGDGFEDLVAAVMEETPRIALTNPPTGARMVQVRLVGTLSNRDGRGAVVELATPVGTLTRWPGSVEAYSTGTPALSTFGVGAATEVGPLRVRWPSGQVQVLTTVPAGSLVVVTEPGGEL